MFSLWIGFIKAPCVDGFETKSQQINSKSSSTATVPSSNSLTDPKPLELIPNSIPAFNNSFNIFPDGVPKIFYS